MNRNQTQRYQQNQRGGNNFNQGYDYIDNYGEDNYRQPYNRNDVYQQKAPIQQNQSQYPLYQKKSQPNQGNQRNVGGGIQQRLRNLNNNLKQKQQLPNRQQPRAQNRVPNNGRMNNQNQAQNNGNNSNLRALLQNQRNNQKQQQQLNRYDDQMYENDSGRNYGGQDQRQGGNQGYNNQQQQQSQQRGRSRGRGDLQNQQLQNRGQSQNNRERIPNNQQQMNNYDNQDRLGGPQTMRAQRRRNNAYRTGLQGPAQQLNNSQGLNNSQNQRDPRMPGIDRKSRGIQKQLNNGRRGQILSGAQKSIPRDLYNQNNNQSNQMLRQEANVNPNRRTLGRRNRPNNRRDNEGQDYVETNRRQNIGKYDQNNNQQYQPRNNNQINPQNRQRNINRQQNNDDYIQRYQVKGQGQQQKQQQQYQPRQNNNQQQNNQQQRSQSRNQSRANSQSNRQQQNQYREKPVSILKTSQSSGIGVQEEVALPTFAQMKSLQVKAELTKLGDPMRAYAEKINEENSMQIDTSTTEQSNKISIDQRFNKIQGAKPNLQQVRINQEGGANGNRQNQNQRKTLRMNAPKVAGSRRLQVGRRTNNRR